MKEFCFWDEDDLSNLPPDFKLVPFNVDYIDPGYQSTAIETPKTLTSKMSPPAHKPSAQEGPKSCSQVAFD